MCSRRQFLRTAGVVGAVLVALADLSASSDPDSNPGVHLRGHLIDKSTGRAIPGAVVSLFDERNTPVTATSDELGAFRATFPTIGWYQLTDLQLRGGGELWPVARAIEVQAESAFEWEFREERRVELKVIDSETGAVQADAEFVDGDLSFEITDLVPSSEISTTRPGTAAVRGRLMVAIGGGARSGYVRSPKHSWLPVVISPESPERMVVAVDKCGDLEIRAGLDDVTAGQTEVRLLHKRSGRSLRMQLDAARVPTLVRCLPVGSYDVEICPTALRANGASSRKFEVPFDVKSILSLSTRDSPPTVAAIAGSIHVPANWGLSSVEISIVTPAGLVDSESVVPVVSEKADFELMSTRLGDEVVVLVGPTGFAERVVVGATSQSLQLKIPDAVESHLEVTLPNGVRSAPNTIVNWGWMGAPDAKVLSWQERALGESKSWSQQVPAGWIVAYAAAEDGSVSASRAFRVAVGATATGSLQLGPTGSIRVHATFEGRRVPLDFTRLEFRRDGRVEESMWLGKTMVGVSSALRPGKLGLRAVPPTGFLVLEQDVDISAGVVTDVTIQLVPK